MLALTDNPRQRIAMGNAGRQKVHTRFDLQKNVEQLMQCYRIVEASSRIGRLG